jgi:hypothetical protein
MAQAQVTLKVSPAELQMIDDALRMYAWVNRDLANPQGRKHPLEGFHHIVRGNDHRVLLMQANKIRQDIGLK